MSSEKTVYLTNKIMLQHLKGKELEEDIQNRAEDVRKKNPVIFGFGYGLCIADLVVEMVKKEKEGFIIDREVVGEILKELNERVAKTVLSEEQFNELKNADK